MNDNRMIHIWFLLVGCFFCSVATIYIFINKGYNKEKRQWMIVMQAATAILLLSDALAWEYRGGIGDFAYFAVRISNFMVFLFSNIVMMFFHGFICCSLLKKEDYWRIKRVPLVYFICIVSIILVVISQFTNFYYYVDAQNIYHRTNYYFISLLLPLFCIFIDASLLLQYRRHVSAISFLTMFSYIVLPIVAAIYQAFHYGMSLINVSIGTAMVIIFVAMASEQNEEMNQLLKSKIEADEKLEISTVLNKCIAELSSNTDFDLAIYNLLGTINDYFQSDCTYVFEKDENTHKVINTHSYIRENMKNEVELLTVLPPHVYQVWMDKFKDEKVYYISSDECEVNSTTYHVLKENHIERLLAVPLLKDNQIIGFLGVNNPKEHFKDVTILSTLQFFVTKSIEQKKESDYLKYLSYRDMLTHLYNRNRYMQMIDEYRNKQLQNIAVAYIDLNDLKRINDHYGHTTGDELIQKAGKIISHIFPDQAYRVGGDEFVIVVFNIDEKNFYDKIDDLQKRMKESAVSISIGVLWKEKIDDLSDMLKIADCYMYEEKKKYHQNHGYYL